jgi:hypothetical protein
VCQTCDSQCLTCLGSTATCTSCQSSLYFTSALNTCTSSCPSGYLSLTLNLTCTTSCPTGSYPSSTSCLSCPTLCSSCTSSSSCQSCVTTSTVYFYNSMCYAACPADAPYPQGSTCVTCSVGNCASCSGSLCVACQTGFLLIEGLSCVTGCGTGQTYNPTTFKCEGATNNTNSNTTNTTTNTTTTTVAATRLSFVPLPYFMVGFVAIGVVLFSKFQHPDVKFVACVLPMISCLALAACITNLILSISTSLTFTTATFLELGGLGLTLMLNLFNLLFICLYMRKDQGFQ